MGYIFRFFRDRLTLAADRRAMWAGVFQGRRHIAARSLRHNKVTLVATGQWYNPSEAQRAELWAGSTRNLAHT